MRLRSIVSLGLLVTAAPACALVLGDFSKGSAATCTTDAQCDDHNPCTTDTCDTTTGACAHTKLADGPVPGYTPPQMNCQTESCSAGMVVTVADDPNVPTSPTPCVIDSCSGMTVVMTNAAPGTSCGVNNQVCDGSGNCIGCTQDSDCANPGACKSVTCKISTHTCLIADDAAETACTGGAGAQVCDGMGNCVACVSDADCASGNCLANTCALADNGDACTAGNECTSNHCANGVCCNSACDGTCMACTAALTGAHDGTCQPVMNGTAPVPASQCPSTPPCSEGTCDGTGACTVAAPNTPCGTETCTGGMATPPATCNGTGACVAGLPVSCGAYTCNAGGTVCLVVCGQNAQCEMGYTCVDFKCE
jgi:hypothetical protein